ncbi:MAG: class I SAM-dependent methyltransferase [Candidatus Omnitrophica bacterium]|nr:class I SAM-dependent methyltransferase [Candidatus Omnitrophota bacterium]MDD5352386.1 class I SAM-dependent methyltransferase [Candidatus Omnitrophota bacterium]MDD5549984.1 class I SAM-dependent methyltransferase [Candidatus Omnitrophota bacterium]
MIEFDKVNPNLSKLSDYISEKTRVFFTDNGGFRKKYFENIKCYHCNKDSFVSVFYDRYGFRHVRCSICGMVYVNPRLKEKIVHDLYSEDDYTQYYKIKLLPALEYRRNVLAVNKYNQIVNLSLKKTGKVLDIGCGLGEVLSIFKERGWGTTAIEFNPFAADYAKEHFGISVVNKSVYDFNEAGKFDVIMLWGVLEHLYDPSKILKKCKKLLTDKGLLVIEVPSADSLLVRYAENTDKKVDRIIEGDRHLMLFSVLSFKEMLGKNGFIPKKLISNGLDVATIDRLFMEKRLTNNALVDIIQEILDESLQGDLLRGFFTKG